MRVPLSWLREFADVDADADSIADALIRLGFEVEGIEHVGAGLNGPLVTGKVQSIEELAEFKKPIRFCQVDVGETHGGVRGIVCGARNFAEGDVVVVALPGSTLPGGFAISARETYGRTSDGMICSERELGLSQEHSGIMVLPPETDIGAPAAEVLGLGDVILDVSVNPDRGYAMSVRGLAREVAAAFNVTFTDPAEFLPDLPPASADARPRCATITSDACSLFVLHSLHGINPAAATPRWMSSRLSAAGMRPVSLIVDVTNYVMLELGQPLHAFDAARVSGPVQVRYALSSEQLELIDHTTRHLAADDIVIADDAGVLSLAGIMGGVGSEISESTTAVLLEGAHFDSDSIAASCRRHRLSTDASRRFERGVDPTLAPVAVHRAASLLVELASAVSSGFQAVEVGRTIHVIETTVDWIQDLLGMSVTTDACVTALRSVGCNVDVVDTALRVLPPSWRPDLIAACDLAEEVARVVGYDAIPALVPSPTDNTGLTQAQRARRVRDNRLAGLGWTQVMLSPFTSEAAVVALGCEAHDPRRALVSLVNPLSDQEPFLRSTLIPGLIDSINRNRSRGFDAVALFEASAVHRELPARSPAPRLGLNEPPTADAFALALASLPTEYAAVAGVAAGAWREASWDGPATPWQWQHALEAARSVVESYGETAHVRAGQGAGWHPGRCAELRLGTADGVLLGWAGELHPRVIEAFGLPARAVAFEVLVDALESAQLTATVRGFGAALATSPVVKEDIAVVVAESVSAAAVADALRAGCGELLESLMLFDIYAGEQVGKGRKSLAFALKFRHPERSLTDDEVAHIRAAGLAAVFDRCGGVLRGA